MSCALAGQAKVTELSHKIHATDNEPTEAYTCVCPVIWNSTAPSELVYTNFNITWNPHCSQPYHHLDDSTCCLLWAFCHHSHSHCLMLASRLSWSTCDHSDRGIGVLEGKRNLGFPCIGTCNMELNSTLSACSIQIITLPAIPIAVKHITMWMTAHAAFWESCAITVTLIARCWLPDCLRALVTILTVCWWTKITWNGDT